MRADAATCSATSTSGATARPTARSATTGGRARRSVLLTTTGRRSGERDGRCRSSTTATATTPCIVASKGGAPDAPRLVQEPRQNPEVEVQIKGDRFRVRAREAEGEERARLWELMNGIWPHYDEYATRTDREIPVVVLERE